MTTLNLKPNPIGFAHRHDINSSFGGTDWGTALLRAGCQDHLQHPSRRGDQRVMHGTLASMASSASRHAGNNRVCADLQRIEQLGSQ